MTADPIKNVRIALATFFSSMCAKYPQFGADREDVKAMMDKLRQDVDRDVRNALIREEERKRSAEKERQMAEELERSRHEDSLLEDERMAAVDGEDNDLDELLGHSTKDREEEAAERARILSRRRSASAEDAEKIVEMQKELRKEGVREDRAENELLDPVEEKEIQRLPAQPLWDMQVDSIEPHYSPGGGGSPLVIPLTSTAGKSIGHHPAHIATPRGGSVNHSPVALQRALEPAKPHSGGGGGASHAPMEVDSPATSMGVEEDDGGRMSMSVSSSSPTPESMATDDAALTASTTNGSHASHALGKLEAQRAALNGVESHHPSDDGQQQQQQTVHT